MIALAVASGGCPLILGVDGDFTLGVEGSFDATADGALTSDGAVDADDEAAADGALTTDGSASDGGADGADAPDTRPPDDASSDSALDAGPPDAPFFPPSVANAISPCGPLDGGLDCAGSTSQCCYDLGAPSCLETTSACNGAKTSQLFCDETSDCAPTAACCVTSLGGGRSRTLCGAESTCAVVACRKDADCAFKGLTCVAWPCLKGPIYATCGAVGYEPSLCY